MDERVPAPPLTPEQASELLGRLMLAWDGQWFLKVAESCGLEKAVELNAKVRTSFGRIEIREYLKALGIRSAGSVQEAVRLVEAYGRLFLGDGLRTSWEMRGEEVVVSVQRCVPQEGAGRAGLKPDTPCIACETVWGAWLETALPGTRWVTEINHSLGRGADSCEIVVRKEPAGG
jgi:hypothetical protein